MSLVVQIGHGPGPQGLFFQVVPGAEVLVLYPDGDPDAGVALAGLSSGANVAPLPSDGSGAILMALLGVTIRSASGLPASPFVKGDLLTGGPPGAAPPQGGLAAWINAGLLYWKLRQHGVFTPRAGWPMFLLKELVALATMAGVLWWSASGADYWLQSGVWARIERLAWVIAAGTASYFGALWLMGFRFRDFSKREV